MTVITAGDNNEFTGLIMPLRGWLMVQPLLYLDGIETHEFVQDNVSYTCIHLRRPGEPSGPARLPRRPGP